MKIESFLDGKKSQKWDDWEGMKDSKVKLYTGKPVLNNKRGIFIIEEKSEKLFSTSSHQNEKKTKILVLTNEFELSAKRNCRLLQKTLGY